MIPVQTLMQINQSGLYIYWFILLNMISHMDSCTSQFSSKYVPYSLHRSTDHISSILGIILVVLYKASHLIPHKHILYFIRHSIYVHFYQDRTTTNCFPTLSSHRAHLMPAKPPVVVKTTILTLPS